MIFSITACVLLPFLPNICRAGIGMKEIISRLALGISLRMLLDVSSGMCFLAATGKGIKHLDFLVLQKVFKAISYINSP